MTGWIALVALAAAFGAAGWLAGRRSVTDRALSTDLVLPSDHQHLLDLVRRAHRAAAAVLAYEDNEALLAEHPRGISRDAVGRGEALARVALHDGRQHVVRQDETVVAVGDGGVGFALVFPERDTAEETVTRALADLRRLCAGLEAQYARERRWGAYRRPGAETLQAVLADLCERASEASGTPAVIVLRDPMGDDAHVRRVSHGADRRLETMRIPASSGAGRAAMENAAVTCETFEQMFGQPLEDRRHRDEFSMAFPLRDGGQPCGALIVYGLARGAVQALATELEALAMDMGPRVAHLQQVWAASHRSTIDPLTGLGNRRACDEELAARAQDDRLALLMVDLDHFKQVNDDHGHAAGDAALRHVAAVLRKTLREQDVPCRVGGEEIAIILPGTRLAEAEQAGERVRRALAEAPVAWGGRQLTVTCSVGVAAKPETTTDAANLMTSADAALYRAKDKGRNRVEVAG